MDIPYLIFILLLLILTYYSFIRNDNKSFLIALCVVFVFIGLRAPVVGADTWNYYLYFTGARSFYNEDTRELEPAFLLYNEICRVIFFKEGQLYILMNTFLSFFMIAKLVKKYSERKTLSVLFFFFIVSYPNYFVALRQILGISFLLVGVWCVAGNKSFKWLSYLLFTFVGYSFHTSIAIFSAIFLVLYFVRINRLVGILAIILSVLFGLVLQKLDVFMLLDIFFSNGVGLERLEGYADNADQNFTDDIQIFLVLRYSLVALISIIMIPKEKISNWFTLIYLFGVCLQNIFFGFVLIGRLTLPFDIFGIIVYTWIFSRGSPCFLGKRRLPYILTVLVILYFTQSFIKSQINYEITSNDRMHPYYFFFEDYRNHPSRKYVY